MVNYDYQRHPVVGRLSISGSTGFGKIKVYGYMDGDSFKRLSTSEARNIFSPDGKVFASKTIQRDFYGFNNSIVKFYAMPNTNEDGSNDYVWNYEYGIVSAGTNIVKLKEALGQNGESNYNFLVSEGLLGKEKDVFVHSGGKLFFIKGGSDSRIIPFCTYNDNTLPIIGGYPDYFYVGNRLPEIEGSIDVTSDDQLIDWFLRIAKADWSDIQSGSGEVALHAAKEALLSMKNLPENIAISRIKRLQSMIGAFIISRESLQTLARSPWFKPTIDSAVDRYRDDFLGNVVKDQQQELERLKESHQYAVNEETAKHNKEIAALRQSTETFEKECREKQQKFNEQITYAKIELERIVKEVIQKKSELAEAQNRLDKIAERKDEIISDFNVVREVLGLTGTRDDKHSDTDVSISLKAISYSEKRLPFYKGFENNLEKCLKLSQTKVTSVSELAKLHAHYSVLLLPNLDVAMAVVAASGKAWYHTAYVSVAWKSFKDVWAAGLQQTVSHCDEKPNDIHYFVLRNINLSCLSNYLQPLADMMAGYIDTFPETESKFPDNLRILLTVSEEELMPMSKGILQYFGCASKTIETVKHGKINFEEAACLGYMDTSLLFGASKQKEELVNYYEDYVDE